MAEAHKDGRSGLVKYISAKKLNHINHVKCIPKNCPRCGTPIRTQFVYVIHPRDKRLDRRYLGAECWKCHSSFYAKGPRSYDSVKLPLDKPSKRSKRSNQPPQKTKKKEASSAPTPKTPELFLLPKQSPEMNNDPDTIAVVNLKFGKNYGYLTITNNSRLQETKEKGIYWIQRELAYKALIAMFLEEKKFIYKDRSVKINYFYTNEGPRFNEFKERFLQFSDTESPVNIYLCEASVFFHFANFEELTALIFIPEINSYAPLTVYYNELNDRYYSRISDYKLFLKTHGLPINKLILCSGVMNEGTLNSESKLKILGYSVNAQDDYSQMYREKILQEIIEGHLMTKREIMRHLDFLINIHNSDFRFDDAVRKWTHDLRFVSNYTPSHHRVVIGTVSNPKT